MGSTLDEQLYARLVEQDWTSIIAKLTLAAKRQLVLCGMPRDADGKHYCPSGTNPEEYAMEAMVKVHKGCLSGENKWDPTRGDLYPFLERLVRRLITDDKKKYSKRGLAPSYEELDAEPSVENACAVYLNVLFDAAGPDVQELILAVQEHVNNAGGIIWSDVQATLGISKYEMNKRRDNLASLMEKHDLHPQSQPA